MMSQTWLVLRRKPRRASRSIEAIFGHSYGATDSSDSFLTVDTVDLHGWQAERLRAADDLISMAPVVPLHHITPTEAAVAEAARPAAESWGLKAVGAHGHRLTGSGAVVAMLDTGIDTEHPAFSHLRDRIERRNFTSEADVDLTGHGTHCAGVFFGGHIDGIRVGVSPGVRKVLIAKVVGSESSNSLAVFEALQWVIDRGASIISLSLGFDVRRYAEALAEQLPPDVAFSRALRAYHENLELFTSYAQRISTLRGRQILLVAAAGNESRRHEQSDYVIQTMLPAAANGFLAVGALAKHSDRCRVANFSNTGVRLTAPGVSIQSALPGGRFGKLSGTSMAVPHVCGVAALWLEHLQQQSRTVSGQLLQDRLLGSCSYTSIDDAHEADVGAGLVQAPP